jgi:hypothetical protein
MSDFDPLYISGNGRLITDVAQKQPAGRMRLVYQRFSYRWFPSVREFATVSHPYT